MRNKAIAKLCLTLPPDLSPQEPSARNKANRGRRVVCSVLVSACEETPYGVTTNRDGVVNKQSQAAWRTGRWGKPHPTRQGPLSRETKPIRVVPNGAQSRAGGCAKQSQLGCRVGCSVVVRPCGETPYGVTTNGDGGVNKQSQVASLDRWRAEPALREGRGSWRANKANGGAEPCSTPALGGDCAVLPAGGGWAT